MDNKAKTLRFKFSEDFANELIHFSQIHKHDDSKTFKEVENLKGKDKFKFDYYLIKGAALFGMKKYEDAQTQLLKANEIYNSDIRVLNLLGFTFINLKNYDEALKIFNASLSLKKDQVLVKRVVEKIKNEKMKNK